MSLDDALVWALIGSGGADSVQGEPWTDRLATAGWSPERLRRHAADRRRLGEPWPYPVPGVVRTGLSAAQLKAALDAAVSELGLIGIPRPPGQPRALTADERRLMTEVPPHHGS